MSASGRSASDPEPALDDPAFARLIERLGPFEARPRLAVAVSGGPDSLALSLLAGRWAKRRSGAVIGLTVDHGLRPGSADEARMVGRWLARHGLAHVVLPWTGVKPSTGLQAAAREERYRLLGEFCRAQQILHLLLAHHQDDQAETVALRAARGSGPIGLAGMPAVSERRGYRILRPLLGVPKAQLLETLRCAGQPWLDDPWNSSPAFARGRLRAAGPPTAPDPRLAQRRTALDRTLALWLARHARPDPLGFVDLDAAAFRAATPEVAADAVRRVLQTVGARAYPPRSRSLDELLGRLCAGACGTLGGVLVRPGPERLRFIREARPISTHLQPLARELWFDHRFRVSCRRSRPDLSVGALGERGWLERRRLAEIRPGPKVERAVGESLPALLRDGTVVAVPQLGLAGPETQALDDVSVSFHPRYPLAGAPHAAPAGP